MPLLPHCQNAIKYWQFFFLSAKLYEIYQDILKTHTHSNYLLSVFPPFRTFTRRLIERRCTSGKTSLVLQWCFSDMMRCCCCSPLFTFISVLFIKTKMKAIRLLGRVLCQMQVSHHWLCPLGSTFRVLGSVNFAHLEHFRPFSWECLQFLRIIVCLVTYVLCLHHVKSFSQIVIFLFTAVFIASFFSSVFYFILVSAFNICTVCISFAKLTGFVLQTEIPCGWMKYFWFWFRCDILQNDNPAIYVI